MSADQKRMNHAYDVFNGDADGICALHQLRLAEPLTAKLITGAKRDIDLLCRFKSNEGDRLTVLDISLDSNIAALREHIGAGAVVTYFDHHNATQVFEHERLHLHCDMAADVCTSILVNRYLDGRYREWAVVAAYGDNLPQVASLMAGQAGVDELQRSELRQLGMLLNYNAYGETVDDLHFHPEVLYERLHVYLEPADFIRHAPEFALLKNAYADDIAAMQTVQAYSQDGFSSVYILPQQAWARRVSGILANKLSQEQAGKSIAVLTAKPDGNFIVSVRSGFPDSKPAGAFCSGFSTGGGRRGAAGINHLAEAELDNFVNAFRRYFDGAGKEQVCNER